MSNIGKESLLFHFDILVLLFMSFQFQVLICYESDSIFPNQTLSGHQTISSQGGVFEMGLFSPGNSGNYYLGIWYKNLPLPEKTVVWVANRDHPVSDPYCSFLEFAHDGNLVLNSSDGLVWSTNLNSTSPLPFGILGDDGNFIVYLSFNVLWQSFDHPSDTWLPTAQFRYGSKLMSWKDKNNPAPGLSYAEVDIPAEVLLRNGPTTTWIDANEFESKHTTMQYNTVNSSDGFFEYSVIDPSDLIRYALDRTGQLKQFVWWQDFQRWNLIWMQPPQECDSACGDFSICDNKSLPTCHCIKGFKPKIQEYWNLGVYSHGCVRDALIQCDNSQDTFFVLPNTRYPQNPESVAVESSGECHLECLVDCYCFAYAYDNKCFMWKDSLGILREVSSDEEIGGDLYVRVAAPEKKKRGNKWPLNWILLALVAGTACLFGIIIVLETARRKVPSGSGSFEATGHTLMNFKHQVLRKATKNFTKKLGQGGFGTVYKGKFPNSTLIAVKELSGLMQGEKQFRAEMSTIGVIQHKNLVQIRGYCVEDSKKFIVYEYIPNGSLESHLFHMDFNILDWEKRYNIALGTAKALAYLHEECRDCIIHCDIKPENILLDAEYNPKVADFGLAKILSRNFSRVLTTMRGTRGYLAPEWFSGEAVTAKVDVYSFGQVLFEIISGRRNMDLLSNELSNYFPALVFNTLKNGAEVLMLVDSKLDGKVNLEELTRACKAACWCTQDNEKNRPTMRQVVQILQGILDVGVPPIPRFFQSLAETSAKENDIKGSEADITSSSQSTSFTFQTLPFQHKPHYTEEHIWECTSKSQRISSSMKIIK